MLLRAGIVPPLCWETPASRTSDGNFCSWNMMELSQFPPHWSSLWNHSGFIPGSCYFKAISDCNYTLSSLDLTHRMVFRLVSNQSEKCDYDPDMIWIGSFWEAVFAEKQQQSFEIMRNRVRDRIRLYSFWLQSGWIRFLRKRIQPNWFQNGYKILATSVSKMQ